MALSLIEVTTTPFRTTRSAERQCDELLRRLGWKRNYLAARLAIARSLGLSEPLHLLDSDEYENLGRSIRGQHLFGEGQDVAAWVALVH